MTRDRSLRILILLAAATPGMALRAAAQASTATNSVAAASVDGAAEAFARYTAQQGQPGPWTQETVEIDASLPKLSKAGKLRAIRRLLPFGQPQYQVLEMEGDRTVKQQVINRYLTEDAQNSKLSPDSIAITPANYKFQYKGIVDAPGGKAYVFAI